MVVLSWLLLPRLDVFWSPGVWRTVLSAPIGCLTGKGQYPLQASLRWLSLFNCRLSSRQNGGDPVLVDSERSNSREGILHRRLLRRHRVKMHRQFLLDLGSIRRLWRVTRRHHNRGGITTRSGRQRCRKFPRDSFLPLRVSG